MNLHQLVSINTTRKKRGGQGHGSGRGKTAGRGQKGQLARNKVPLRFEGGALPLTKRLPYRRGKGRNKSYAMTPVILNVGLLNVLPDGTKVDSEALVKYRLVKADEVKYGIKILGDGEISHALTITLPITKGAKAKIEKAGGTVVISK